MPDIVTDTSSDFYEGVRAVLVDKDRQYNWKEGATLEDVDLSTIERNFNLLGSEVWSLIEECVSYDILCVQNIRAYKCILYIYSYDI